MRKLLPAVLALALFVSCSTTVDIHYTEPSEVDMSSHRSLAVAPVKPYSGLVLDTSWVNYVDGASIFDVRMLITAEELEKGVGSYAENLLMEELSSSDYYDLMAPSETVNYLTDYKKLSDLGYSAVLVPEITVMELKERVRNRGYTEKDVDENGNETVIVIRDYYLHQTAGLEYTIRVIDTASGEEIASKVFKDSRTYNYQIEPTHPEYEDMSLYFRRMLRGFRKGIRRMLLPENKVLDARLMRNKPESKRAEEAYDAFDNDDGLSALAVFQSVWQEEAHVPSGYNAALLLASFGDVQGALSLLEDVLAVSDYAKAEKLYKELEGIPALKEE